MCGRFSLSTSKEKLEKQFGKIEVGENLRINFNVAPTQNSYIITNDQPDLLQYFQWGLIPFWSKDGKNSGRLINARKEGIESKPSFRGPFRYRRCWVLADSFYEWRRQEGQKVPYRIFRKNEELLVFAGLWDVWSKGPGPVYSFTIITTPPNREMASVHNRMPAILTTREERELWLRETDTKVLLSLLETPPDDILDMYRVPLLVNNVRNNGPELHQRVADTDQPELFG